MSRMVKGIKMVIGILLLGISAFYLLGVCLVIGDARKDASYQLSYCIQAEQTGCEYLGQETVINGERQEAEAGYGFYQLTFRVENLSSVSYYEGLENMLAMDGGYDREIGRIVEDSRMIGSGIYDTTAPVLPGKTQADLVYYVEVKEEVSQLLATYRPNWDEDPVRLDVMLDKK